MKWTKEQTLVIDRVQEVLDNVSESNAIIYVDAVAGSGKTTVIKEIVSRNPDKAFIYTAFNKKIVEDGIPKFGIDNCKTFHALAYKYVSKPNIGNLYPGSIKEKISYTDKKLIIDMLDKYCLSQYLNVYEFAKEYDLKDKIIDYIIKYLNKMANREIRITFNYMLKELHHNLADGNTHIHLGMLFVDEAQDLTPVMLEIFKLIQATIKVYLGDTSQNIYSFLNLVSAFTLSKKSYDLTTSFRLFPEIAKDIEIFCKKHIKPEFTFKGVNMDKSDPTKAFITYTNAEIVNKIYKRQQKGKSYIFTKPIEEIFKTVLDVEELLVTGKTKKPKLWIVQKLLKTSSIAGIIRNETIDEDIRSALHLLTSYKKRGINIKEILDKAKTDTPDPNYLIGTAHSIKGLEFGTVKISNGLNRYTANAITKSVSTEACKLYYVAVSRAKHTLQNAYVLKY